MLMTAEEAQAEIARLNERAEYFRSSRDGALKLISDLETENGLFAIGAMRAVGVLGSAQYPERLKDEQNAKEELNRALRRGEAFERIKAREHGMIIRTEAAERKASEALKALAEAECGGTGTHGQNLDPACDACVALCRLGFCEPSRGIAALLSG